MNIVFAGTPEFACQSLRALVHSSQKPVTVLTQPDRPAGRGKKLTASAVKEYAQDCEIPLLQPDTLRSEEVIEQIGALHPDVMVVAAYGLILPQSVLELPKHGCVNVHASLLPRWRGAAPIQAAILAGDDHTGVSLMQMEAGLDSGPVFSRESMLIGENENAGQLHDRLAVLGGEMLVRDLPAILNHSLLAEDQGDKGITYAGKIRNADALLDWRESAEHLLRVVRAFNPVPGAWFQMDGERVKCWVAESISNGSGSPGSIVAADRNGIDVCCGEGILRMHTLQRPGRKRVSAAEIADQLSLTGASLD